MRYICGYSVFCRLVGDLPWYAAVGSPALPDSLCVWGGGTLCPLALQQEGLVSPGRCALVTCR